MKFSFNWSEETGACCGVMELGHFSPHDDYNDFGCTADTEKELYATVFAEMTQRSKDRGAGYCHIWFVKKRGKQTHEYEMLRRMFMAHPGVNKLGTHTNPNTQNRITGYGFRIYGR